MFQSTSLTEMRIIAEQMTEKAGEMKMAQIQAEKEGEKSLLEFEYQLKEKLQSGQDQLKNMENQLKKLDLDIKEKEIVFDKEIKEKKIQSDNFIKVLDIMTRDEQETAWMNIEKETARVDQLLKEMELLANVRIGHEKYLS